MRCFQLLVALAALAYASVTMAETMSANLPPVPKTVTGTVTAIVAPKAETPKVEKTEKIAPAPLPKAEKAAEEPTCETAPMPPVPSASTPGVSEKVKNYSESKCNCKVCSRKPVQKSVVFVTNELLRKPIYDVEKALWEAEGRRLNRENARINAEAEELMEKSAKLAAEIKATDSHDLHAKLMLIKQERTYANEANNLAVRRAALELKLAEHAEAGKKLDAKHVKLYHNAG